MPWPAAFVLTLVVELPLVLVLARVLDAGPQLRVLGATLLVNAVSHPLLWFVLVPASEGALGHWGAVAVAEAAVLAIETLGYALILRIRAQTALWLAAAANLASFLAGLVVAAS